MQNFEKSQLAISRSFASEAKRLGSDELSNSLKNLSQFLGEQGSRLHKIEDNRVLNDFLFDLEIRAREAQNVATIQDPISTFDKLSTELKEKFRKSNKLNSRIEPVIDNFIAKARIGLIPKATVQSKVNLFNIASKEFSKLSNGSVGVPLDVTLKQIDAVRSAVPRELEGETDAMDILAANAKQIAIDRSETHHDATEKSSFDFPIQRKTPDEFAAKTGTGFNINTLQAKNPMLALAFLRIRDLNSAQVNNLIAHINKEAPESPEPAYIRYADDIRSKQLAHDAISYGEQQNLFFTENLKLNVAGFGIDVMGNRFKNSRFMLEKYGVTNIFKKEEALILKNSPLPEKVFAFTEAAQQLKMYNIKNPNKRINSNVLDRELNDIDPDLYTFMKAASFRQDFSIDKYPFILEALKTKEVKDLTKNVPLPLMNYIPGGRKIFEMLVANDFISESLSIFVKFSDYFDSTGNYFYPKGVAGQDFQKIMRHALNNPNLLTSSEIDGNVYSGDLSDLILRNIDVDKYVVLRKNGNPVLTKYGQALTYSIDGLKALKEQLKQIDPDFRPKSPFYFTVDPFPKEKWIA